MGSSIVAQATAAYRVYIGTEPFTLSDVVDFAAGAGGNAVTAFDGTNPNQIFVTAPAFATEGPLAVQVVDLGNTANSVLRGDLLAVGPPLDFRLDSLSPDFGPVAGGQSVTLSGEFLTASAANITTVADATLVEEAEVSSPGALTGWMKVKVVDTRSGGIADGDYYVQLYAAPTMT